MGFGVFFQRVAGSVLAVLCGLNASTALAAEFLPPEQAFAMTATPVGDNAVQLQWRIADGYYMYRERLTLHAVTKTGQAPALETPKAETKFDANFNKTMEIYHQGLKLTVDRSKLQGDNFTVEYQGCAQAGLCYPPQFAKVAFTGTGNTTQAKVESVDEPPAAAAKVATAGALATTPVAAAATANAATAPASPAPDSTDLIGSTLAKGNLFSTAAVFWFAGLLLAFTPCVLPMIPILSSLIAGQSGTVTRRRGFFLALSYVLGMALVYACFGMAAGIAGEGLAASLQNPWVLGVFALVLCTLSLGMFGVFELQMPSFIQNSSVGWSNKLKGGSNIGVFIMGGLSALILGPCVAAPLAGALVYISQTKDLVIGGTALFFMGLGMGVPLLLVGMSAGSVLPRPGAWMEMVKHVFGIILVGTAVWIISPVIGVQVQMLLWAAVFLGLAYVFGGVFAKTQPQLLRLAGVGCAALSALLLVGAASGGKSLLQPLAHFQPGNGGTGGPAAAGSTQNTATHSLPFKRVSTQAELDTALAQASAKQQVTMLDFYADWCVACKEFESFTFSDPTVQARIAKGEVQVLQADVTANNAQDKALLKRFSLFGPPGIVFMKGAQPANVTHKVIGYQNATDFLTSLDRAKIR